MDEQDIAALIELLKMEAERSPRSDSGQVCQRELFREDHFLLEMWPEACRRIGIGKREFPAWSDQTLERKLGHGELKGSRGRDDAEQPIATRLRFNLAFD